MVLYGRSHYTYYILEDFQALFVHVEQHIDRVHSRVLVAAHNTASSFQWILVCSSFNPLNVKVSFSVFIVCWYGTLRS